jgi:hypothetical protein
MAMRKPAQPTPNPVPLTWAAAQQLASVRAWASVPSPTRLTPLADCRLGCSCKQHNPPKPYIPTEKP